ncbi:MAG: putative histidine kinase [Candidatus Saccharibacteria bacterium]|nr:putative histidine kinase [Candidatus Saccharibacteria bacterium]
MRKPANHLSIDTLTEDASLALLRRGRAEAEALFLSIGEGAIVTDNHGNISRINNIALQLLGYSTRELVGKWYPEAIVAEDESGNLIPNMERPNLEVFLTGKPVFDKVKYLRKDGTKMSVAVTVSPILLNNSPIGAIEVFRDITSEVELENAKDEFISIASHELRTPATIVKQYLSMVMGGYAGSLTEDQLVMLTTAFENNERQLNIINDLLRVARAEANAVKIIKEDVDLVLLVDEIIKDFNDKFNAAQQQVTYIHNVESAIYSADPVHLRMVLENLLSNANKYTPDKGKIAIKLTQTKTKIKVSVKDTGVGISKRDIPKLFYKFSRINNPLTTTAGGSGLGLYWVKKLVMLHGAEIKVSSAPKKGSTFTVIFNRTNEKTGSGHQAGILNPGQ